MKKAYSKPQIAFDDFELSTSIAAGCGAVSHHVLHACGLFDPDLEGTVFTASMTSVCNIKVPDNNDTYEMIGVCYEVPIEDSQLFSS